MKLEQATARSAWYLALATINRAHVDLWQENGQDAKPFAKLLSKQTAFLRGELKSRDNLMRFFNDFSEWRSSLDLNDELGDSIVDLACSALYASVESVFDEESDDVGLMNTYVHQLQDELIEVAPDYDGLREYLQDIEQEFVADFAQLKQIPISKSYFQWLAGLEVSLFGLEG